MLRQNEPCTHLVQRRYTKMVNVCKGFSYEARLKKLGLTTLESRYIRADMILVFKILGENKNIYPRDFLTLSAKVGRGNSRKLYKDRCNLNNTRNSFTHRVVDQWNKLPDEVVMSSDVNEFKGKFDYWMRCAREHS